MYEDIPTLEELHALELEGLRADVILVDAEKDRKLSMLKQLIVALVKGLNSNTAAVIKKIAGLVSIIWSNQNIICTSANLTNLLLYSLFVHTNLNYGTIYFSKFMNFFVKGYFLPSLSGTEFSS